MEGLPHIYLYARVSTDRQAANDVSIPDQLNQLRSYCKNNNWPIIEEFQEAATASNDKRAVFQQMIMLATDKSHPADIIMVHSLSRLFRNTEDAILYGRTLKRHGVKIHSLTQPVDESPVGQFFVIFMSCMDEWQITETSKHVKRTLRANAISGFFNGSTPPFGYMTIDTGLPSRSGHKKVLGINEAEAVIVRQIFNLCENGTNGIPLGGKKIASYLNDNGILRRGELWDTNDVWRVLNDRAYIGKYEYGNRRQTQQKEFVLVNVPIIISEEQFKRVALIRHSRSPKQVPPLYISPASLLTGLIHCGLCNSAMCICSGKGGTYRYFRCNFRNKVNNKACTMRNVRADKLETLVLNTVLDNVLTTERVKLLLRDFRNRAEEIQRQEIQEYKNAREAQQSLIRRLTNLTHVIEETGMSVTSQLKKRALELEKEYETVQVQLDNLKIRVVIPDNIIADTTVDNVLPGLRQQFSNPDSDATKSLVRLLIKDVKVYQEETTVQGSNFGIVEALVAGKDGTHGEVPSFIPKWRAWRDSNSRPPGS